MIGADEARSGSPSTTAKDCASDADSVLTVIPLSDELSRDVIDVMGEPRLAGAEEGSSANRSPALRARTSSAVTLREDV